MGAIPQDTRLPSLSVRIQKFEVYHTIERPMLFFSIPPRFFGSGRDYHLSPSASEVYSRRLPFSCGILLHPYSTKTLWVFPLAKPTKVGHWVRQSVQNFEQRKDVRPIKTPVGTTVSSNVRNVMLRLGMNITELASVMNVSRGTIYNRFLYPDEFQIGELEKLADYASEHGMPRTTAKMFFEQGGAMC